MVFISISTFSKPVFIFNRSEGKFTFNFAHGFYIGYKTTSQTLIHTKDALGNPVDEYTITCSGAGDNKCESQIGRSEFGVQINNNTFDPLFFDEILVEINQYIDIQIVDNKVLKGSLNKKVSIVSKEGNSCLLSFDAIWNVNEKGEGTIVIQVNEIK